MLRAAGLEDPVGCPSGKNRTPSLDCKIGFIEGCEMGKMLRNQVVVHLEKTLKRKKHEGYKEGDGVSCRSDYAADGARGDKVDIGYAFELV